MTVRVARLAESLRDDFFRVHCDAQGEGWCNCVAWWVPTWDGWGERTAEQNRALRERLFDRGEYDGYLLYVDDVPAGWSQCGPRDRLEKLCRQLDLTPDPETWAITCFVILRAYRRRGHAHEFLREIVADLREQRRPPRPGLPAPRDRPRAGRGVDGARVPLPRGGIPPRARE